MMHATERSASALNYEPLTSLLQLPQLQGVVVCLGRLRIPDALVPNAHVPEGVEGRSPAVLAARRVLKVEVFLRSVLVVQDAVVLHCADAHGVHTGHDEEILAA